LVVTNFRFQDAELLQLSLPLAAELLPRASALLDQAHQLLTTCSELSDRAADLEAVDAGWNLGLQGRWDSTLPKADLSPAKQRLYPHLIQLTHPDAAPRPPS
jgi:hypothetical protein